MCKSIGKEEQSFYCQDLVFKEIEFENSSSTRVFAVRELPMEHVRRRVDDTYLKLDFLENKATRVLDKIFKFDSWFDRNEISPTGKEIFDSIIWSIWPYNSILYLPFERNINQGNPAWICNLKFINDRQRYAEEDFIWKGRISTILIIICDS